MKNFKKLISFLLILCILFSFTACIFTPEDDPISPVDPIGPVDPPIIPDPLKEPESSITHLQWNKTINTVKGRGGLVPYDTHWYTGNGSTDISKYDLSKNLPLAYSITFSEKTVFPIASKLPAGFNSSELLDWGKDPGLNIDILHKYSFDGTGASVAYVDQSLPDLSHEQYKSADVTYYKSAKGSANSMHAPAVLSLLAGKDIGTAPNSKIYFFEAASWLADQTEHAQALYDLIEVNNKLSEDSKIKIVGFSDNVDSSEKNEEAFKQAIKACEEAGIMVFLCSDPIEFSMGSFIPLSDKNNPNNVISYNTNTKNRTLCVPTSGRTTAATLNCDYIYWAQGGLSWATPYVLGLVGTALTIDNTLTKSQIVNLLLETAYITNKTKVVNPVGFIAKVLEGVGKIEIGKQMLSEVAARQSYTYAVINSNSITNTDKNAIINYLSNITDSTVLLADIFSLKSAEEIFNFIKNDAVERGGKTNGIMIFGDRDIVPSFSVNYKVQMQYQVDRGGVFYTDFFYSNFKNDSRTISNNFSVYDNFEKNMGVDLIPQHKVTRLMLPSGKFNDWFNNYKNFALETNFSNNPIANFSNPIFRTSDSIDDFGVFLKRMQDMGIVKDIVLYANKEGKYPVTRPAEGNFSKENLTKVNGQGIYEFIINSHGQQNNIDQAIFENTQEAKEIRISLINSNNINNVLSNNYYYLNVWTCSNAWDLKNNIIEQAMQGKCVGAFAASAVISNNGVNNRAGINEMKFNNFYYFYYIYLKSLNENLSRSDAFFAAQQEYAAVLTANSNNINYSANYQFNMYNLIDYHNIGVFEPLATAMIMISAVMV